MPNRSVFLRAAAAAALVSLGLAGCATMRSQTQTFEASLSAAQEVPPTASTGSGQAEVLYNRENHTLTWRVSYSGLTGTATAGHIHGPAAPGANAGVVIPFSSVANTPITGEKQITPEQAAQLESGQWYVNIHTARFPAGEIRGQLHKR